MKSILQRTGLLTCFLFLGLSYESASAEIAWPSKCDSFGEVTPNENPSPQQLNRLLTNAALEAKIPPEVVKAVAAQESGLTQFNKDGQPVISEDCGIGIMQITNQPSYDQERLKVDIYYNIQAGVEILSDMYHRTDLPKIKGAGPEVIENWYFPIMAYNGIKPVNSPLVQEDGTKNTKAYQEKVFALLQQDSYLNDTKLGQFPFSKNDFEYKTTSDASIVFIKKEYTITDQMHASSYHFHRGDKIVVTEDRVKLRPQPSSILPSLKELANGTTLIIDGDFVYDQTLDSKNQFVWYPVKTADQKLAGYISSAYIIKKLDSPIVNPMDDNDLSLSGKTAGNVRVQIMNGIKLVGSADSDINGNFKANIPVLKAGTQLSVAYKDKLNALSPSTKIVVIDKTAPNLPSVNTVTNKALSVTGKTEAYAAVTVVIAGKTYSVKADKYGYYKVTIPVQNTGTKISVKAKDSKGNISKARIVKVVKVAPNLPSVNKVNNKVTRVTGKSESYAKMTVVISKKSYSTKADKYGNYKVSIPVQNTGTKLTITAKDKAGRISVARITPVVRVAPNLPTVNKVRYKSSTVTGKTEKYAKVTIKIGTKKYIAKANSHGNYKVKIPKQRAGKKLYVYAKDAKGKVSATRIVTVSK